MDTDEHSSKLITSNTADKIRTSSEDKDVGENEDVTVDNDISRDTDATNQCEGAKGKDDSTMADEDQLSWTGKKRANDDDEDEAQERLPTLPLKRARTAYFIFADEKREEVKKQHPGEGVATIAKAIGQLWSQLPLADKEVYETQAAAERERVSRDMKRLVNAGLWPAAADGNGGSNGDGDNSNNNNDDAVLFPVARIRKICKLDPDVKGISKESALLITKATELFCAKLAKECVIMAQMQNRRKLLPEDVVEVCSVKEAFMFLRSDLVDLRKMQIEEMNLSRVTESGKEYGIDCTVGAEGSGFPKVNTLDSYFGKARNQT